jgi:hypothetical protein
LLSPICFFGSSGSIAGSFSGTAAFTS